MIGFLHGVRVLEITSTGAAGLAPQPDYRAPLITSPLFGVEEVGWGFSIHLTADEAVIFEIRPGGSASLFLLDGDLLTLPAQPDEMVGHQLTCPLRAIDDAGNVADFAIVVAIVPSTAKPGVLDFQQPGNPLAAVI